MLRKREKNVTHLVFETILMENFTLGVGNNAESLSWNLTFSVLQCHLALPRPSQADFLALPLARANHFVQFALEAHGGPAG